MTVLKSQARVEVPPARTHGKPKHRRASRKSRLPVSLVALVAALGVLVVSSAYTSGRLGHASSEWADRAYWLGQLLIVVPVAARLLGRGRLTPAATSSLVIIFTVAEYLVNVCYSPVSFTFPDELWHWRSTVDLLNTGKLFTVNYALPISPRYPGLEELTSSFVDITKLPVFVSGLIVAGVAHLLFILGLFLIFRAFMHSHRMAGVAILIYSSTPDLSSFDSMYVYQTLAVAFLALAVLSAWRATEGPTTSRNLAIAILAIAATVVTHHATSYVLAASLVVLAVSAALARRGRPAILLGTLAFIAVGAIASWIYFVAPGTISYFMPTLEAVKHGMDNVASYGRSASSAGPAGPVTDQALAAVAVVIVSVLLPLGWLQVRRHARNQPWIVAMAVCSVSWYAIVMVRFAVADGSELAGRASTFVYIPVSVVVTIAIARPVVTKAMAHATIAAAAVFLTAVVLVFDGLVNGWPPYWERLPGSYQVAGFERSVGPEEIAAARWALTVLGPGNRFAADTGNYPVMASYGYQNPIRNIAYLYTSAQYTPLVQQEVAAQALHYVLVDRRLSQSLPASGKYFPIDPNEGKYKHPLPLQDLTKFNRVSSIARIYDSGNIVIYDLQGF
jgi:hypothetical protein